MTPFLQGDFIAALALAGLLGFRHGFDADHIAVVDGLTRARQLRRSYWSARIVGLQFAAGHSAAVLLAALLLLGQAVALPQALDGLGLLISTTLLLSIALANAMHALSADPGAARPVGPLATLLLRCSGGRLHPALVGVAFALSLDTLAQAALFAAQGHDPAGPGGVFAVALLAAAFGLGMMLADAGNGLLLAWFAQRSDGLALQASRCSSGFIAVIALATVAAGWWRHSDAGFARAWEQAGAWVGASLLVLTTAVYGLWILHRRRRV